MVLDHSIQEDRNEHVVPYRRLSTVETTFQVGAHQIPCLMKNITIETTERIGMLSHQSRDSRVVVEEDHLRTPREYHWKWRMQQQLGRRHQRLRPLFERPQRSRAQNLGANAIGHL